MRTLNCILLWGIFVFPLHTTYGTTIESTPNTSSEMQNVKEDNYIIPNYSFKNGQNLNQLKIHYLTAGSPQKNKQGEIENAVLFLHWTGGSGSAMFERFKNTLLRSKQPFDAQHYYLIFPDNIGQGKSSKPSDGLRMKFPNYSYQDMVNLQHRLITQHLKIAHLKMVVGTSMGGMHSWMWSELYPQMMDGVMAIVCLPKAVDGRNLLWRQIVVNSIKNDPSWQNGNYKTAPYALKAVWPFVAMMVDGVPHLQHIISNSEQAGDYIHAAMTGSTKQDANDVLYVMEASKDYNPEPLLATIKAKVFALDFTDDALDSPEFYRMNNLIKRVPQGRWILQKGTANSYGHFTLLHPELWVNQAKRFVEWVNAKEVEKY